MRVGMWPDCSIKSFAFRPSYTFTIMVKSTNRITAKTAPIHLSISQSILPLPMNKKPRHLTTKMEVLILIPGTSRLPVPRNHIHKMPLFSPTRALRFPSRTMEPPSCNIITYPSQGLQEGRVLCTTVWRRQATLSFTKVSFNKRWMRWRARSKPTPTCHYSTCANLE